VAPAALHKTLSSRYLASVEGGRVEERKERERGKKRKTRFFQGFFFTLSSAFGREKRGKGGGGSARRE